MSLRHHRPDYLAFAGSYIGDCFVNVIDEIKNRTIHHSLLALPTEMDLVGSMPQQNRAMSSSLILG